MYIAKNNDLIILAKETKEELEQALQFMIYDTIEETDIEYKFIGNAYVTAEEQAQKEKERIQELRMTMSDFFDGTIGAWGVDKKDLTPIIEETLALLPLDEITKKIALNNFDNAQNYYRKHTLFTLLSNRTLKLNDTMQVFVTDEHWDKFFNETDKGNKEAYKELPVPELIPVEEPEEDILA